MSGISPAVLSSWAVIISGSAMQEGRHDQATQRRLRWNRRFDGSVRGGSKACRKSIGRPSTNNLAAGARHCRQIMMPLGKGAEEPRQRRQIARIEGKTFSALLDQVWRAAAALGKVHRQSDGQGLEQVNAYRLY